MKVDTRRSSLTALAKRQHLVKQFAGGWICRKAQSGLSPHWPHIFMRLKAAADGIGICLSMDSINLRFFALGATTVFQHLLLSVECCQGTG